MFLPLAQGPKAPDLRAALRRFGDALSVIAAHAARRRPAGCSFMPCLRRRLNASLCKCPRHHKWELSSPEGVAVRREPLDHYDLRTCIAQRDGPPGRVVEEERL